MNAIEYDRSMRRERGHKSHGARIHFCCQCLGTSNRKAQGDLDTHRYMYIYWISFQSILTCVYTCMISILVDMWAWWKGNEKDDDETKLYYCLHHATTYTQSDHSIPRGGYRSWPDLIMSRQPRRYEIDSSQREQLFQQDQTNYAVGQNSHSHRLCMCTLGAYEKQTARDRPMHKRS